MVDDVIAASKCGKQTVLVNSAITTFAKLKMLELSDKKCARIHIGQTTCNTCPQVLVNEKPVKESEKEKYLGDYLNKYANPLDTMEDRRQKGEGILSNITAMLEDVPLGKKRLEVGLTLREAWFLNGTLYNSEVWCSYKRADLKVLEVLDRKILREITGAHSKVPWEMLYLKTSVLPIASVIIARRLIYLQDILKRTEKEIILKVYTAQKESPSQGDWIDLVQEDMNLLNLNISDNVISETSQDDYKRIVKNKVQIHALEKLKSRQQGHQKVKRIPYVHLTTPQDYLTSSLFTNKMKNFLFNLRCESVKTVRNNFHTYYNNDIACKVCGTGETDTQDHLLTCHKLTSQLSLELQTLWKTVHYQDIYGNTQEQHAVTLVLQALYKIRLRLLKGDQEHRLPRP